jgi:DNA-binding LacI/PurR family transcriptional regulator
MKFIEKGLKSRQVGIIVTECLKTLQFIMLTTKSRKFGRSPKLQLLCEQIHTRATVLGPNAKLPTVVQLSAELNVSKATINSALRELEEQNIITRKHGVGLFVSSEVNQKAISLICDSSFFQSLGYSPFWDILLEKVRDRANAKNELIEFHLAQPNGVIGAPLQRRLANDIKNGQIHGIIGVGLGVDATNWIESQRIPIVAVFGPGHHSIVYDFELGVSLGLPSLMEKGCKHIGYWQTVSPRRPFLHPHYHDLLAKHFRHSIVQYGLELNENWIQLNRDLVSGEDQQTDVTMQEQGYRSAQTVFSLPREQWPDGIIINDDLMTHGALIAFQQMGVQAGRDVQIVSHANKGSRVLNDHKVPLTLIEFNADELVETAFDMLESLIDRRASQESTISKIKPVLRLAEV